MAIKGRRAYIKPQVDAERMRQMILGSLESYPHHGGDIEIIREVERIEQAAYQRGYTEGILRIGKKI